MPFYLIISKLFVNRLKPLLADIISSEQNAFVPGRSATDSVLVAQEVSYSKKKAAKGKNLVATKLDMERAYDRIRLDFLSILLSIGELGPYRLV